jgi:shikimate kinase
VIWLRAPVPVLWNRVAADPCTSQSRPPLTGLSGIDELARFVRDRETLYAEVAHARIDTTNLTPAEVVMAILAPC